MAVLQLTPDLGFLNLDDLFDASRNPLLVSIDISELTPVDGDEPSPGVKGIGQFMVAVDGQVYSVPLETRRKLRVKRNGRVRWRSTSGDSGSFRYFTSAPPVFEEDELRR